MATETEVNPYEVAARTRKAARIAIAVVKAGTTELPEGWAVDGNLRALAAALGENRPSDETLAVVRELVNGS